MKIFSKRILCLIALFFMLVLIPQTALAENVYKKWSSKNNIAPTKQWVIKFNSKLNTSTVTNKNITVTDKQNKQVNVVVTLSNDKESIIVAAPSSGYTPGETYNLNIENRLSKENGQKLSKPIKMPFTIREAKELSQTINDVTVRIKKVEQDTDSLKVYVTYINNSNKEIFTGDCLSKIVYNKKQYAYNHDFNFERYYKKTIKPLIL